LAQAFVVCRTIYEDRRTHEHILVGPFSGITLTFFPAAFRFSIYAHLADAQGVYHLRLELRDSAGDTPWAYDWPEPIRHPNPLEPHRITLHDVVVDFPKPGRYDLVLLANGDDLAHHALELRQVVVA
jgi:hypothetical protein